MSGVLARAGRVDVACCHERIFYKSLCAGQTVVVHASLYSPTTKVSILKNNGLPLGARRTGQPSAATEHKYHQITCLALKRTTLTR